MAPIDASAASRVTRARPRRALATAAAVALVIALPALALAHPLGNFTINHYAGIRVEPDRVVLDVVVDQAEIPTFQEKLRIDTDGDGSVSDAETEAERVAACPVLAGSLTLNVAGRGLDLVPVAAGLTFPPGAAGLETMRLVCTFTAALPAPLAAATPITFQDTSHGERLGWREIVVTGSGVTVAAPDLPATSSSNRLTAYPKDLLTQPLDVRSAAVHGVAGRCRARAPRRPGRDVIGRWTGARSGRDVTQRRRAAARSAAPAVSAPSVSATAPPVTDIASASVPGGVGSEISGLLESRDLTPLVLLGSIVAALALGAGHALTPGHGKTLMGAYLVGTRGTSIHAIALGLSVTVSHTLGILVLAAIVIAFRGVLPPETFNRYAPVASGLLVLGIGTWLLVGQLRARRTASTDDRPRPRRRPRPAWAGARPRGRARGRPRTMSRPATTTRSSTTRPPRRPGCTRTAGSATAICRRRARP